LTRLLFTTRLFPSYVSDKLNMLLYSENMKVLYILHYFH